MNSETKITGESKNPNVLKKIYVVNLRIGINVNWVCMNGMKWS